VKSIISGELLSIQSYWYDNCIRNMSLWRAHLYLSVWDLFRGGFLGQGTISYSDITGTLLIEAHSLNLRYGAAAQGSKIGAYSLDRGIYIVHKVLLGGDDLSSIQSDWNIEPWSVFAMIKGSLCGLRERRWVALDKIRLHDCRIHVVRVVEDALCSAESHIHEIFSLYSDLGEALNGTARRIEVWDLRGVVVEKGNLSRILLILISGIVNSQRYVASGAWWRGTHDVVFVDHLTLYRDGAKLTNDFLISFEFAPEDCHVCPANGRALLRISIINLRWLIIPIDNIIISELLIV